VFDPKVSRSPVKWDVRDRTQDFSATARLSKWKSGLLAKDLLESFAPLPTTGEQFPFHRLAVQAPARSSLAMLTFAVISLEFLGFWGLL
jgi:hypothetical protein